MKVLRALIVVSICVVILHIVLKYLSVVRYNEQNGFIFELSNRFDLNDENSVPQWLTQVLFLAMSVSAFVAAYLTKHKATKRFWMIVSVLGLILSIDDVATLHEFVLQSLHNLFFINTAPTIFRNAWLLLLPFIVLGFGWMCYKAVKLLPQRTTVIMVIGGVIFITGATLVDSITNAYPIRSFMAQGILGGIEGGLQLIGSSVFVYAIVDYIERAHGKSIARAIRQIKSAETM